MKTYNHKNIKLFSNNMDNNMNSGIEIIFDIMLLCFLMFIIWCIQNKNNK